MIYIYIYISVYIFKCFFLQRILKGPNMEEDMWDENGTSVMDLSVFDKSAIKIRLDVTNQHIAFTLQFKFAEAFKEFLKELVIAPNMMYLQA